MHSLDVNFVKRAGWQRWLSYSFLACGLAAGAYQAYTYQKLLESLNAWENKWLNLQTAQAKNVASSNSTPVNWENMQAELKSANRVIEHLSMPWDALFREIELSIDEQVTLLNVEPDSENMEVRVTGEAKDLVAMLDYVKRLRTVPLFKDAYVVNHQVQQQDPQRPVRFLVTAQWETVLQAVTSEALLPTGSLSNQAGGM